MPGTISYKKPNKVRIFGNRLRGTFFIFIKPPGTRCVIPSPAKITYKVDIVVEGEKKKDTECVADFSEVKAVVDEVLELVDHKFLNEIISYPTSENIALFLRDEFEKKFKDSNLDVALHSIKVWEGKDKWVMVETD